MTATQRTPAREAAWPFARAAVAILLIVAVVMQFERTIRVYGALPEPYASHLPTLVWNFFSYFTNLSNLATGAALLAAAIWAWTAGRRQPREPLWLAGLLACLASYMIVTGIVYNALLRDTADPLTHIPFSNEVVHVVGPVFMLLDVLFAPKRRRLRWRWLWAAVAFPVAWCVYTLVRAPWIIVPASGENGFYPYPFLNPRVQGGFEGVAVYIAVLSIVIAVVAASVIGLSRIRTRAGQRAALPRADEGIAT